MSGTNSRKKPPTQRHFALAEFERYEKDGKIIFATPRGYEVEGNKNIATERGDAKNNGEFEVGL